jgi:hypothetical protein
MFVNWGLESIKWKFLLVPLERISFSKAFKAVLAGCSITMLTPNRMGEYGGRIMFAKENNRLKAISVSVLGSISQLAITIICGTAALYYLFFYSNHTNRIQDYLWLTHNGLLILGIVSSFFILFLFFNTEGFVRMVSRIPFLKKMVKHIALLEVFHYKQLLNILALSLFRYFIFILQYLLLLKVMQVNIETIVCVNLLAVFYFLMAMLPTIGLTELPVRATAAVVILGWWSDNVIGIQAAVFSIWLINLVIPSLIGSLFIAGFKINNER